ncbi:preprotein translocase subunit SecY [archaeon BMS3Bbin15]|nr:preprotein translocase subunit SecY [archaeon BMS3Bbin15]
MGILHSYEGFLTSLPEVERPKVAMTFKNKMKWTGIILITYLVMTNIMLYGLDHARAVNYFSQMQTILASKFGTLITLGIGPIVTGSIILQILVGGKLIDLDMENPRDKEIYQGTQKILSVAFTVFEAGIMVIMGALPAQGNDPFLKFMIIAQLVIAGVLIIYMDEVVSRWGFGSGIGLFIVAGVAEQIVYRSIAPIKIGQQYAGVILNTFNQLLFSGGGINTLFDLTPLLGTIIVFLFVVYVESMRIEIPLTYGKFRGARGRYPIKFIYASNIPVIFASILMANVQLWARLLQNLGHPLLGTVGAGGPGTYTGIVKYFSYPTPIYRADFNPIHAIIFAIILIILSVIFSIFWVETSGMNAKTVAKQLHSGGMQIPGFRGDIRIIERVLQRHIPAVTVLGGAAVGLLAAFGDITGALGGGTGVLLTVGILYQMYESMAKEQLFDLHPMMRKILGDVI